VPERSYGSQLSRQRSGARGDAGRLIRPSDLRRAYPDARLFIIQGHPPDEVVRRTASDRQAASLMRSCAAALARHGVRVIVLPPLESALASKCLARVRTAAPAFLDRGITAVLPAITQVQTDIFDGQRGARASIWELALDVSVFDIPEQGITAEA